MLECPALSRSNLLFLVLLPSLFTHAWYWIIILAKLPAVASGIFKIPMGVPLNNFNHFDSFCQLHINISFWAKRSGSFLEKKIHKTSKIPKLYYVKVGFFLYFSPKKNSKTIRSWSLRHFRFWLYLGRFLNRFWIVFGSFLGCFRG